MKFVYFCRMDMFNCTKIFGKKLAISKGENFTNKVYNKYINHGCGSAADQDAQVCIPVR